MVVSRASAEHYTWGGSCDGWHLVRRPDLGVIEERMPPGTTEVRHRHARARQFFRVLGGRLAVEVEGRAHALAAGEGLEVAPGEAHRVWNEGPEDAVFLVV